MAFHVIQDRTGPYQVCVIILCLASAVGIDFVGVDVFSSVSHHGFLEACGRDGGERRRLACPVFIECEGGEARVVLIAAGQAEKAEEYQQDSGEAVCVHEDIKLRIFLFPEEVIEDAVQKEYYPQNTNDVA